MNPQEHLPPEDLALSRVVDGVASDEDWAVLDRVAVEDRGVWERLAQTLRAESELRGAAVAALDLADRTELPATPGAERGSGIPRSLGWAAMLLLGIGLGLLGGHGFSGERPVDDESLLHGESRMAHVPSAESSDPEQAGDAAGALRDYLEKGAEEGLVVGELPQQYMRSQMAADGSGDVEVLYVRRIVEKRVVDQLYELGHDEVGDPTSVPSNKTRFASFESL